MNRVDLRDAKLRNFQQCDTLHYGSNSSYLVNRICTLLRHSLGNRAEAVALLTRVCQKYSVVDTSVESPLSLVWIGLILNREHAFRLVDHGPLASQQDDQEVSRFRDLWGEKAELRRFKDGRISECVVWDAKDSDERAKIPLMIVKHILGHHLNLEDDKHFRTFQGGFDSLIRLPNIITKAFYGQQFGFKGAMVAFDSLAKVLRSSDQELPLALLEVIPTSSDLRYTSVFAPLPFLSTYLSQNNLVRWASPMEIVLVFERSSHWPDSFDALQKMKLLLLERLAEVLITKVNGLKAAVVLNSRSLSGPSDGFLEILTPDGWFFSASIRHDRDIALLERLLEEGSTAINRTTLMPEAEKQRILKTCESYSRRFIYASMHRVVAGLCHKFPAYSGTVRLVKRWLASHWLLGAHISEEVVELLCAKVFLGDSTVDSLRNSMQTPETKERGFFQVMSFLKGWVWQNGIAVPLNDLEVSSGDHSVTSRLKGHYTIGEWTISIKHDGEGHVWTSNGPTGLVARRVISLATSTVDYIHLHENSFVPKVILTIALCAKIYITDAFPVDNISSPK